MLRNRGSREWRGGRCRGGRAAARLAPVAMLLIAVAAGARTDEQDPAAPVAASGSGRIWAAPGDTVGWSERVTIGLHLLESEGDAGQLANDTGLRDRDVLTALLALRREDGDGRYLTARGWLSTDDQMPGSLRLRAGEPGRAALRASYERSLRYDPAGARDPYLTPGLPAALDALPRVRRETVALDYRRLLPGGWRVRAGYEYGVQDGLRAGLPRSLAADGNTYGAPAAAARDLWRHRLHAGGDLAAGAWALDWRLEHQRDGGRRALETTWETGGVALADRSRAALEGRAWHLRLGSSYDASERLRLFAHYGYQHLAARPDEERTQEPALAPGAAYRLDATDNRAQSHAVMAGALYRPRPGWRLRATARLQRLDQEGVAAIDREPAGRAGSRAGLDKERRRQVYGLDIAGARARALHWSAAYRYERSDETRNLVSLDEYLDGNVLLRVQAGRRDRDQHDISLKARHRLSARWTLSERLSYRREDIAQRETALVGMYAQGDRRWSRWRGEIAARGRLAGDLFLDAGYLGLREEFTRLDLAGAGTSWDADRFFANASWAPAGRVTLFGAFAIGRENYDLDTAPPAAATDPLAYNPVAYEGITYRFAPGVTLRPGARWEVEAHHERVRNRESVSNDSNRWYGRATWRAAPSWLLSATYRRYEFAARDPAGDHTADLLGLAASRDF